MLIDYGYTHKKMKNTLQAISNHKFANILSNIGNVDITHNISFELFKKLIKQMGSLENNLTTQKEFLIKMGIKQRAEIISKNHNFLKKYHHILKPEGIVNLKTDSEFMHGYTLGLLHGEGHEVIHASHNVYKLKSSPEEVTDTQTFYEKQYLEIDKATPSPVIGPSKVRTAPSGSVIATMILILKDLFVTGPV